MAIDAPNERDGLFWYMPSNGTEFEIFQARCSRCRFLYENDQGFDACRHRILDKIWECAITDTRTDGHGGPQFYHHPDNLDVSTCPATCLKFQEGRDDNDPEEEPPAPDVPGQMLLFFQKDEPCKIETSPVPQPALVSSA